MANIVVTPVGDVAYEIHYICGKVVGCVYMVRRYPLGFSYRNKAESHLHLGAGFGNPTIVPGLRVPQKQIAGHKKRHCR